MEQYEQVKQPAYIDGNVYLQGAKAFDREQNYCVHEASPEVSLEEEGDTVFLEITLPEEMFRVDTQTVTSALLGMTRLSEARFETPEGTALVLDRDLAGNQRGEKPVPGPLEGLHAGRNRVAVWRRG